MATIARRVTTGATFTLVFVVFLAATSDAGTVAYWRFETGPASSLVPAGTPGYNYDPDVPDWSGNGNELDVWDEGGAGFAYRADVPAPTIHATGATNNYSIKNTGGYPAAFTDPAGSMNSITPSEFTIEVSWKPENGGHRTVVGRDARNVTGADGNLAALYLQAVPGDALAIKFVDEAGYFHVAQSASGILQGFDYPSDNEGTTGVWHNIAAVSDGSTLSLYLDKGTGQYNLVAQTDLTLSGSPNTALTDGFTTYGGVAGAGHWTAGDWSVGRGLYAGGHLDRAWGFIDEVRISDVALAPSEFLFSVPEPSSLSLVAVALALFGLIGWRKRSGK